LDFEKKIAHESALINECVKGNRIAQRMLYDQYVDYLMLICMRYIPHREEAREILMDSFVNAFRNIDRFEYRGDGSLKAWLKKITINQCLMYVRKQNFILSDSVEPAEIVETGNSIDAISNLNMKELLSMIQGLPDGYRTIFNLYVFEEMKHREIALLLNISESTSKSQLHKAKMQLQKKLLQNSKKEEYGT